MGWVGLAWTWFVIVLHATVCIYLDICDVKDLDEMNIEIIRNTLTKSYLESFYNFCLNIGGETADVMCELLAFEADRYSTILHGVPKKCPTVGNQ